MYGVVYNVHYVLWCIDKILVYNVDYGGFCSV